MKLVLPNQGISATHILENSKTIADNSIQNLKFNVMHKKDVQERLIFKKYIIKKNRIETYFDREYKTSMKKSPDHYIFLSSLINLQRMIYLLMCDRFKVSYNKDDEEKIKIWPTSVNIEMNGIVRKKKNIMQDFKLSSISQISEGKYQISGESSAESTILLKGEALVYII